MYIAVLMSGDDVKRGFKTESEAWEYVKSMNCEICIEDGAASACAVEWEVFTEKEWDEPIEL